MQRLSEIQETMTFIDEIEKENKKAEERIKQNSKRVKKAYNDFEKAI